ncbi:MULTISPECIES: UbiA family prenyltransferase [Streptosporangium]|uniref:4-hydroxybenzoate polyprenyltransferase n=1 Tax=Streptosporangium brasiliense TaxID=47480 RepID=A0ABT9QWP0_9ACTN|nr:UbiA family prenyltransferase [Streptosporangium brasiliense]MDP9861391.1 4-hydroxybenzoate polyprenyltransferase [Streptosporangium brasiliense]
MSIIRGSVGLSSVSPVKITVSLFRMCVTEARPSVLVIFMLRFVAGAALGVEASGMETELVGRGLVWGLAIFAVYLFNGVMDVREDRVNGSSRPIARGILDPGDALVVVLAAALTSVAGAVALGGPILWMVLAVLALGYVYSGPPFHWKRRSGATAAIGAAAGLLTYAAGFAGHTGGWSTRMEVLCVFMLTASLWMGLVGVCAKDLSDIEGDAAAGRTTLGVTCGEGPVRLLAAGAALTVAVAFGAAVLIMDLPMVGTVVTLLTGAVLVAVVTLSPLSHGNRLRRRRSYRAFMVTQYALHLSLIMY